MPAAGPLHETFARLAGEGGDPELSVATDPAPARGEGWVELDRVAGDRDAFDLVVAGMARSWATERRDIAGAAWLSDQGFALLLRTAAAFLAERRVPDLGAPGAAVWIGDEHVVERVALGPSFLCLSGDPAASDPAALVVDGEEALLRRALEAFHARQAPLVELIAERCRRPRAALWRHSADTVAEAFLWAGEVLGDRPSAWSWGSRAMELAPARLRTHVDFRRFAVGDVEQVGRVRAQCCLYYRTPAARYCFSCPLKDDGHRLDRLAQRAGAGDAA